MNLILLLVFLSSFPILFCDVRVGSTISDKHVEKNTEFEIEVFDDLFENDDDSTIYIDVDQNDWVFPIFPSATSKGGVDLLFGQDTKVVLNGNYIYFISIDYGVFIFDVTNIESPIVVGKYLSIFDDFVMKGDIAYTIDAYGLNVVDFSSKENPTLIKTIENGGRLWQELFITDDTNTLFIMYGSTVTVFDITVEDEPEEIDEIERLGELLKCVCSDGDYVYVLSLTSLSIFETEYYTLLDVYSYGSLFAEDGYLSGDFFYISTLAWGVRIMNVTDRYNIEEVGDFSEGFFDLEIHEEDDTAFFLTFSMTFQMYSISSKETPVPLGQCDDIFNIFEDDEPTSIAINEQGTVLYVSFQKIGFLILNVTDREDPCQVIFSFIGYGEEILEVGKFGDNELLLFGRGFVDISITDDLRFAIACDEEYGLVVFDIVNTENIEVVKIASHPGMSNVRRFIYEANYGYIVSQGGFFIYDLSSPEDPQLLYNDSSSWLSFVGDICIVGNVAYMIEMSGYIVMVIDISDLENPFKITDIVFDIYQSASLAASSDGDYLYVSGLSIFGNDMLIVNISDVYNPEIVSFVDIHGNSFGTNCGRMLAEGEYVYISDGTDGLIIVNVEDKQNPTVVGSANTKQANDVVVQGEVAFVANLKNEGSKYEEGKVDVISINDKSHPFVTLSLPTINANSLAVMDNVVFVADYDFGIKIFHLDILIVSSQEKLEDFCGDTTVTLTARDSSSSVYQDFSISKDDYCNGRGLCQPGYVCGCDVGYNGDNCETWSCGSVDFKEVSEACNGNGNCVDPDVCECRGGYIGENCQTNILYAVVMAPILSISFIFFGFCLLLICYVACAVCCSLIVCLLLGVFGLFLKSTKQKKGLKRFTQLRNFDLYLHEQELEDDTSIAHLKFDKSLFEVDMDGVKTLEVLGEGGSSSIVFKALWRGRHIAFKCFKTRMLCQEQDSFTEFEKEVSVMSSIAHPNIVQFFGAVLKPPRVGILMELCPKGEILEFVMDFRSEYATEYPIFQKIRLLSEVVSALEYLHSKNIIHRDLKCENVLIGVTDSAKLMDFGVSRVVDKVSGAAVKTKRVGTSFYMAPEIVSSEDYDEKCDVFSLGIMIHILVCEKENPYEDRQKTGVNIELKVANDPSFRPSVEVLTEKLSREFKWLADLAEECWDHNPKKRKSCEEIREILEKKGSVERYERSLKEKENTSDEEEDDSDDDEKDEYGGDSVADLRKKLREKDDEIKTLKEKLKDIDVLGQIMDDTSDEGTDSDE